MPTAYIDASGLVAIAFNQAGGAYMAERISGFSHFISANLLEAEIRSAFMREEFDFQDRLIAEIEWVMPERPLTLEMQQVLAAGYQTGGDLWHLAVALYAAGRPAFTEPGNITFLTLDTRQRAVAAALGFQT